MRDVRPSAFDGAPKFFDGIKVWTVGWQEKKLASGLFNNLVRCPAFVEGGIIKNNHASFLERREQMFLEPFIEECRCTRPGECDGSNQFVVTITADE